MAVTYPNRYPTSLGVNNTDTLTALYTQFNFTWNRFFDARPVSAMWPTLCEVIPTQTGTVKFPANQSIAQVKEWTDLRQSNKDVFYTPYQVDAYSWEITKDILRDEIEDDQTGMIIKRIQSIAIQASNHRDRLLADHINAHIANTVSTAAAVAAHVKLGMDGKYLFATNHAWLAGYTTSQSNLLSGTNTGKLDLTYGYANLSTAITKLRSGFVQASGDTLPGTPTTLMVAPDVFINASRILNSSNMIIAASSGSSGTSDLLYDRGTNNPLYGQGIQLIVNNYLTAGYWVLMDLSNGDRPFGMVNRQEWQFRDSRATMMDFNSKEIRFGGDARYQACVTPNWYRAVAGDGT